MKSLFLLLTFVYLTQINIFVQKECAYFLVGSVSKNMDAAIQSSKDALSLSGFKIIGEYNPSNSENLAVVCCRAYHERGNIIIETLIVEAVIIASDGY